MGNKKEIIYNDGRRESFLEIVSESPYTMFVRFSHLISGLVYKKDVSHIVME